MRGLYIAFFVSDLPPDTFYLDHTEPLDLSGKAVYAAATVIADCLLVRTLPIDLLSPNPCLPDIQSLHHIQ
jgi:hypothetical protein